MWGKTRSRWDGGTFLAVWLISLAVLLFTGPSAEADPFWNAVDENYDVSNYYESYSGLNATQNMRFSYVGGAYAPFGKIEQPGVRLRVLAGFGEYTYGGNVNISGHQIPVMFKGENILIELSAGYSFVLDPLYMKVYLGASWEDHKIDPLDQNNPISGQAIGTKAQLETWLNLGENAWLSTDASYATTNQSYNLTSKLGYRALSSVSIGVHAAALGNEKHDALRGGVFVRSHEEYGDMTVSVGVSGDYDSPTSLFGALSYSSKF